MFVTVFITTLLTEETLLQPLRLRSCRLPQGLDVDEVERSVPEEHDTARLYYGTQLLILKSDTVLKKSIDKIGMSTTSLSLMTLKNRGRLRNRIRVSMKPETSLITITVKDKDPRNAALYANIIATEYIQNNLERSQAATRDAITFSNLSTSATRKKKCDERVHKFKCENDLIGVEEQSSSAMERLKWFMSCGTQLTMSVLMLSRVSAKASFSTEGQWRVLAKEYAKTDRTLQTIGQRSRA